MYHTIKRSTGETNEAEAMRASAQGFSLMSAEGAPLTSYKKDVDMTKDVYYGLSTDDLEQVTRKLKKQKDFLDYSTAYDRINKKHLPLSQIVISVYHSPERYYAQTQNRVNTIETIARQRGLKPLFMTLTLPSEYHRCKETKKGKLKANPKYNGSTPKESVKVLTRMFTRLRHDRALKELTKEKRIFIRVNEPHKDGTPHTHILMFVPADRIQRVERAYRRLYDARANDIQVITGAIDSSVAYVMKYINKVLPLSKKVKLTEKEQYLNAWYSKNRVIRFNASRTLAPLSLYRLLHKRFSMLALTRLVHESHFSIYVTLDTQKIVMIKDEYGETLYTHSGNYDVRLMGNNHDYSQTSDSAIGSAA